MIECPVAQPQRGDGGEQRSQMGTKLFSEAPRTKNYNKEQNTISHQAKEPPQQGPNGRGKVLFAKALL